MSSQKRFPRHIAIIMDGNGRWAQSRGHARVFGHIRGAARVKEIVKASKDLGVEVLTVFAFSTENWKRPEAELGVLWRLFKKFLSREVESMARDNVKLRIIGEVHRLDPEVRAVAEAAMRRLEGNTGLQFNIAISYGSRRELSEACRLFSQDCVTGIRRPEEMNEALLERYLWTAPLGEHAEVDLVIRTSGEHRTSNFLLWQAAYAEYYFTDLCWPEFTPDVLKTALEAYSLRDRRFGGISPGAAQTGDGLRSIAGGRKGAT